MLFFSHYKISFYRLSYKHLSIKTHQSTTKDKNHEMPKITQNTSMDRRNEQKEEAMERVGLLLGRVKKLDQGYERTFLPKDKKESNS